MRILGIIMIKPFLNIDLHFNHNLLSEQSSLAGSEIPMDEGNLYSYVFYVYRMQMNATSQTGLLSLVNINNPEKLKIIPHELTRPVKENLYLEFLEKNRIQSNPVFLIHKNCDDINKVISLITEGPIKTEFKTPDGVKHTLWEVGDLNRIKTIESAYKNITKLVIADGHHRYAAAKQLVGQDSNLNNMYSLLVPDNQISILSFHRIIKMSELFSKEIFLQILKKNFDILKRSESFKAKKFDEFGMYYAHQWYELKLKKEVSSQLSGLNRQGSFVFDSYILRALNITDQRHDEAISFINETETFDDFEQTVNKSQCSIGFTIESVKVKNFLKIAESGILFPPHSTWFIPKPITGVMTYRMISPIRKMANG